MIGAEIDVSHEHMYVSVCYTAYIDYGLLRIKHGGALFNVR